MVLGEAFYRRATKDVAARLDERGKTAMLIFEPANVRYVTGVSFMPAGRPLAACIWADGRAALFVPHLDAEQAGTGWVRDIRWYAEYPAPESPVRWMAREAGGPLVVDTLEAAAWAQLRDEVDDTELADPVGELRRVKTPAELDLIERAAEYADLALERTFARLTSGSAEREVLAEIVTVVDGMMRAELGDLYDDQGPAITGSLQSGTRAALPDAPASARRLTRGDSVIAEFVANVGGYHAWSGATFFVGDPLRDVVRWVEAAIAAQDASRAAMAPGTPAETVDQAARKVLDRLGMISNVRHRTGQGIGLARREAPWLTRGEQTPLAEGMVLVNRPGLYVPGRTGTRNAETVAVGADGPRVLNPRLERWSDVEARLKEF
ncbi:MAG TPA: Xaa-Pro peptidase family protein [Thermomicrobiaceae bacterium]|nr:Xaa-Pro peptidase family protein [Thermomicrobiaceae bacterium]